MKNQLALLIGLIVAAVLIAHMFSFQVRYDEIAVRATFEKADESNLIDEAGLYWKLPWPIHRVYTYSQKLQLLDGDQTEGPTADNKVIIVKLYATWRIDDALAFYRTQRSVNTAERNLRPMLGGLANLVSQYEFRQFVNTDESQLRLDEFERACTEALRRQVAQQGYGIHIEHVGVRQILLSQQVTPAVFDAMRQHQQYLAEKARSEGTTEAQTIREAANSIRDRILAFAERRAQAIRDEGNREAAAYFADFRQDPQFAIYLVQLETLRETLSHNTTFILDASQMDLLTPLTTDAP